MSKGSCIASCPANPVDVPAGCSLTAGIVTCPYIYTGAEVTLTLPSFANDVSATLNGAHGGGISDSGTAVMIGGLGCVVEGAISGQAGNTIYLSVGSNGWAGGSGYAYMKVTFGNGRWGG